MLSPTCSSKCRCDTSLYSSFIKNIWLIIYVTHITLRLKYKSYMKFVEGSYYRSHNKQTLAAFMDRVWLKPYKNSNHNCQLSTFLLDHLVPTFVLHVKLYITVVSLGHTLFHLSLFYSETNNFYILNNKLGTFYKTFPVFSFKKLKANYYVIYF